MMFLRSAVPRYSRAIPRLAPWHVDPLGYEKLRRGIHRKLRTYVGQKVGLERLFKIALESISQGYCSSQSVEVFKKRCPEQVSEKGCILLL